MATALGLDGTGFKAERQNRGGHRVLRIRNNELKW
jgi:hypothetical protein